MTRYDFLEVRWVILSNVQIDFNLILLLVNFWYELSKIMTRYIFLDLWFWEMFELTRNIYTFAQIWLLEAR